jgi:glutamine synthetase
MSNHEMSPEQIIEEVSQSRARFVKLAVTDIDGVLRGKYVHKEKFLSVLHGNLSFCDVIFGWDINDQCYDNSQFTGWHTGYPDAEAQLDLSTFRWIPWEDDVPFFLGDFAQTKGTAPPCPRRVLKEVITQAADMDLHSAFSMEFEWFNFNESAESLASKGFIRPEPISPGMHGYSMLRTSQNSEFLAALNGALLDFGVPIESLHTETGPGVLEAAILYSDALEAADRAVLFKWGTKAIAHDFGIMPSFMAKWNSDLPGCSGHLHQSLWNEDRSTNLFFDASGTDGMSDTFRHYLAGQMLCLPEILPLLAPNINSYKRLVEGHWAPTTVTWGINNRTAAMRVIGGDAKSTRLENRVVGSDANPYLAMAASLASGLYGIRHKLEIERPKVIGNAYEDEGAVRLPNSLDAATEQMAASAIARELFDDNFVDHFVNSRRWECRQYQAAVTNWETERYFEIV